MEKDPLQKALLDWEGEGGSIVPAPPERTRASPVEAERLLDPRHRRGSLGPTPTARPLPQDASGAAHLAHLARLLDQRPASPPSIDDDWEIFDAVPLPVDAEPTIVDPVPPPAPPPAMTAAALAPTIAMPVLAQAARSPIDTVSLPTPHEDLDRQPDGVPHAVIGLTALSSVLLAAVLVAAFLSGPSLGSIAAAGLAIVAVPIMVFRLGARAERDRDHVHPSR